MARFISRLESDLGKRHCSGVEERGRLRPGSDPLPIYGAASSEQKQRPKKGGGDGEESGKDDGAQKLAKKGEELKDEMDSLMDEIDSVLEENAEEFVKNYVQRGGE